MSDAVSPAGGDAPLFASSPAGARFAGPDAAISDLGPVGMVSLRGDFDAPAFRAAVEAAAGAALPGTRRVTTGAAGDLVWMAPDELLLTCGYDDAPRVAAAISETLAGTHHMALALSDARAAFRVEGAGARELLAKGAPVDLSPEGFAPGDVRRTRLGQVAAAFWLGPDGAFTLVCHRSVGAYLFDWLKASARDGARPGLF